VEGERREEREMVFLFIKILGWESTITMYIYMVTVDPQGDHVNRVSDEGYFLMFFMKFSLNIRKGTILRSLMGVLLGLRVDSAMSQCLIRDDWKMKLR
jgi:hypothetical protein